MYVCVFVCFYSIIIIFVTIIIIIIIIIIIVIFLLSQVPLHIHLDIQRDSLPEIA